MLQSAAVLNLHALAITVQNIHSLVPIILNLKISDYNHWHEAFLLIVGKFSLQRHVKKLDHPDWARMDNVVYSLLLGTIANDLVETVMEHSATTHASYTTIETQFLGNQERLKFSTLTPSFTTS